MEKVVYDVSPLTTQDVYLFKEGNHFRMYEKFGAHPMEVNGARGAHFAVWAPNAEAVSVMGDFNDWSPDAHFLKVREDSSGIWEGFIPGARHGMHYKYHIRSQVACHRADKADPFAFYAEKPPRTASVVWDMEYDWSDGDWMRTRRETNGLDAPMSIYEMHLGSWMRVPEEANRFLTYREIAEKLVDYVKNMGFTHVEFLPVMEHPFYGSWGYQCLGFFAPTSRYGSPQDFMHLVDHLHRSGIGVILDWVPSHFPDDGHGLVFFDGTHLYEHSDPKKGYHPDWKSCIFNYGRYEVREYLISSALFWLDKYHVDGLRVDAVASLLYLDYSREEGEWIPNEYGGRENTDAIWFIRRFNEMVYGEYPDVQTIAEESTAWPMVSRPAFAGGLGFGMKWKMGWMHDTLKYFSYDPIYRKHHHNELTFSMWYAYTENYILPLSHDEVVYGKGSLLRKMPGDDWRKFANLRVMYGYMFGHPGKKLLFMGGEIGQWNEWFHERSLDWGLLDYPLHQGVHRWVRDLNHFYTHEPAMYECDFEPRGFEWMDCNDADNSVVSFVRRGKTTGDLILGVCNFTPVPREGYRIPVPQGGVWREVLNSDAQVYGGSGVGNLGEVVAEDVPMYGRDFSITPVLPPLGVVFFKNDALPASGSD